MASRSGLADFEMVVDFAVDRMGSIPVIAHRMADRRLRGR